MNIKNAAQQHNAQTVRTVLRPKVGVASLSSPLEVGADRASQAAADLAQMLSEQGCDVLSAGSINRPDLAAAAGRKFIEEHVDAVALTAASWFEDYLVLDLLEECPIPLLFRPLPGMETGALCGVQQLTAFLHHLGTPFASVFGPLGDAEGIRRTLVFLRAAGLKRRLRRARIGMAGHPVNGMTHTAPNLFALKKILGPRVVWMDMVHLLSQVEAVPPEQAQSLWKDTKSRVGQCAVPDAVGIDSMSVYIALRDAVESQGLDAITIGCYPRLMGKVCLAASLLADEGIPMACEGDVHGAVGQYLLGLLTGMPTHNTDWLDPIDDHSVIFTHCGSSSFSLAENPAAIRLASVRLMGQGVCALFTSKPGPVTLLNMTVHPEGYQCGLLEGEALPAEMVFPGNPVRVCFDQPVRALMDWIHETGLGHHWMIGYGHQGEVIRTWARMVGPELKLREP